MYGSIQQLKTGMANVKHLLSNHETEIRTFENKLGNLENTFEHNQKQFKSELLARGDAIKSIRLNLEDKTNLLDQNIKNLEALTKGAAADLRQLASQANDSIALLSLQKQKISMLEQAIEEQNRHIQHLETVMQSIDVN